MRQHRDQPGVSSEHSVEHVQPGVAPGHWPVPAVHHHRYPRLSQQTPCRVQHRISRIEATHLHVHLDALGTTGKRSLQVLDDAWFREERRGRYRRLNSGGKVGDPAVEPVRHPGFVRVDQRREDLHVQRMQHGQAIILGQP